MCSTLQRPEDVMSRITVARRPSLFATFGSPFFDPTPRGALAPDMDQFAARVNELFRSTFNDFAASNGALFPALNVTEDKNEFTVTAELPGMSLKDIRVEYYDGVLTIEGEKETEEKKEDKERSYHVWERRSGSFKRALPLTDGIAEARMKAEYKDGVLTVHLPKSEDSKAKRHSVPITSKD